MKCNCKPERGGPNSLVAKDGPPSSTRKEGEGKPLATSRF